VLAAPPYRAGELPATQKGNRHARVRVGGDVGFCHPDATPAKNAVPIAYFGSAWATLGLMRSE
jgi:hypothetical protein